MNNNNMILGIIAVVAVVAIGGYFLMNNTKPAMENASTDKTSMSKDATSMDPKNTGSSMEKGVLVGGAMMVPSKDIVDNAVNSTDHTTLVSAVTAAELVETLKSEGPFTVFAPTNAAFAKLPAGTVDTLLKPENKAQLTSVLTYHVVPGAYRSTDLKDGMMLKTVNGQQLTFNYKDGKWWINGAATVTIADIISSNGVTHVIDSVVLPK